MTVTPDIIMALSAPLDQARIRHRDAGRGQQVPYLEGYDVIYAANRIFGFDGWGYVVESVGLVSSFDVGRRTGTVTVSLYEARVKVTALGVTRLDVGTNLTSDDRPESHDTSIKGAVTDALKRALRTFGTQFGNDLYDKGQHTQNGQQDRAPRPAARQQPEVPDDFKNAGHLLTWAVQKQGKTKAWVLETLGVPDLSTITDFNASRRRLEDALRAGV